MRNEYNRTLLIFKSKGRTSLLKSDPTKRQPVNDNMDEWLERYRHMPAPVREQSLFVQGTRPGRVYATGDLRENLVIPGVNMAHVGGMYKSPESIARWQRQLRTLAEMHPHMRDEWLGLHDALQSAHETGGGRGVSIAFPEDPVGATKTLRHERIHENFDHFLKQQGDGGSAIIRHLHDKVFPKDPTFRDLRIGLQRLGYDSDPKTVVDEGLAHTAGSGYARLGIWPQDAYRFLLHVKRGLDKVDPEAAPALFRGGNLLARTALRPDAPTNTSWVRGTAFDKALAKGLPLPTEPHSRFVVAVRPGIVHLTPEGARAAELSGFGSEWWERHQVPRRAELFHVSGRSVRDPSHQVAYHGLADAIDQAHQAGGTQGLAVIPPGSTPSEVAASIRRAKILSNLARYKDQLFRERPKRQEQFRDHLGQVMTYHPMWDDVERRFIDRGRLPGSLETVGDALAAFAGGGYSNLGFNRDQAEAYVNHIKHGLDRFDPDAAPALFQGGNRLARQALQDESDGGLNAYELAQHPWYRQVARVARQALAKQQNASDHSHQQEGMWSF